MDDRDDDDNESAVRALNTALNKQAHSLKIFQDDPLMINNPSDEEPPARSANTSNAPSDETHSFLETVSLSDSNSSDIVANDPPASLLGALAPGLGDKVDDEEDDGIQDEVQNLLVSEVLLRKEMERASQVASRNSLEQLSSDLLEATELICAPQDAPSVQEIRAHMDREQKKRTVGCSTIQGLTMNDLGFVDDIMDTVMDAVLEGCHEFEGDAQQQQQAKAKATSPTTPNRAAKVDKKDFHAPATPSTVQTTPSGPAPMDHQTKLSRPCEQQSVLRSSSSMSMTEKQKAFVVRELHNARSYSSRQQQDPNNISTSTSSPLVQAEDNTEESKKQAKQQQPAKREHVGIDTLPANVEFQNKSISEPPTTRKSPTKKSFMEKAKSLTTAGLRKSDRSNEDSGKDSAMCITVGKTTILTPADDTEHFQSKRSLFERAKSLSASWNHKRGEILGGEIQKTPEPAESDKSTSPRRLEYDQEAVASVSDIYVEDEEGYEVEASYQTQARMERVQSQEQRQRWISDLFKKEWLGIKRAYWVAFVLVIIFVLLLGIILLVTAESNDKSYGPTKKPTSNSRPGMGADIIFPAHTQAAFRDPASAQSKAYEWLSNDPSYHQYSDDRKLQRFALATLYYSTNGPDWIFASRVLTYNSDECQWFYSRSARTAPAACAIAGGIVETLMLDHNNLEGTLPPELWLMTNLKYLSLSNNQLMSTIPSQGLDKMTDLQFLGMTKSGLSGPLPPTVGYLESLELLDLSANRLTGTIPLELRDLSNLRELRLHKNGLNGTLPGVILSGLSSLQQLYLFENTLSGSIPSEIQYLQAVEDVFLYNNRLSSSLPTQLGSLTRLQRLWLDRNRFTGTIPKQLGSLQNMMQLNLFSNDFSGSIPDALGNAKSLEQIRLGDNILTGSVPERLCSLLPAGGDNDIVRILSVDCDEVACDCNCDCPRPGSEVEREEP